MAENWFDKEVATGDCTCCGRTLEIYKKIGHHQDCIWYNRDEIKIDNLRNIDVNSG